MYFRFAWRNIWRNRRRSLITIASIVFAVFFANIMMSFQQGVWENMLENLLKFGGYIQIQHPRYLEEKSIDNSIVLDQPTQEFLSESSLIKNHMSVVEAGGLAAFEEKSRFVFISGLPLKKLQEIYGSSIVDTGDYPSLENQIVVGSRLADYMQVGLGDTLAIISNGYQGMSANGLFEIRGISDFGTPDLNKRMIYMPLESASRFYSMPERRSHVNIYLEDPEDLKEVESKLKSELDTSKYRVLNWMQITPEIKQSYEIDTAGNYLYLFVLYLIIGFGIFGTILMMTNERMYEFGVLVSIGMRRRKIVTVIFLETLFLSGLGILMGCLIAFPLMYYFHINPIPFGGEEMRQMYEDFGFDPVIMTSIRGDIFINNGLGVFIMSIVICLYPLWRIMRLKPTEAMKL